MHVIITLCICSLWIFQFPCFCKVVFPPLWRWYHHHHAHLAWCSQLPIESGAKSFKSTHNPVFLALPTTPSNWHILLTSPSHLKNSYSGSRSESNCPQKISSVPTSLHPQGGGTNLPSSPNYKVSFPCIPTTDVCHLRFLKINICAHIVAPTACRVPCVKTFCLSSSLKL